MKRISIFMMALMCLALCAIAQDNVKLSPAQWRHAVAVCAQATAYDQGFGKDPAKLNIDYPQGYTLDDLNQVYRDSGSRWRKIHDQFKKDENRNGTMEDLRGLIKKSNVWRNLVEPELTKWISEHPAGTQELADEQSPDNQKGAPDEHINGDNKAAVTPPPAGTPSNRPRGPHPDDRGDRPSCGIMSFLPLALGLLGSILGLIALCIALGNRKRINSLHRNVNREISRTNDNLQQLANDANDRIKALSIRLTERNSLQKLNLKQIEQEAKKEKDTKSQSSTMQGDKKATDSKSASPKTIYLSKPDENDDFIRASEQREPGNSIYELTTQDGKRGSYKVIDNADVHRLALMMPTENLTRACTGNAIQTPKGTRIVTDRPGEAVFEKGKWHITIKAIIHYES